MCKEGAMKRCLNLEVAEADAKHWWETGMVPLRATPLKGEKTLVIEANSLKEARNKLQLQMPKGFQVLSKQIVSDGTAKTIYAYGKTTEAAFKKAQDKMPPKFKILEKAEISTFKHKNIKVTEINAIDEQTAVSNAKLIKKIKRSNKVTIQGVELTLKGNKGFLGIGRKQNQYTVEMIEHVPARVKIKYKPMVKISVRISEQ
jgi:hypothetical protein